MCDKCNKDVSKDTYPNVVLIEKHILCGHCNELWGKFISLYTEQLSNLGGNGRKWSDYWEQIYAKFLREKVEFT